RAQQQSGGRNYRNPWDAVEQPDLSRRRDAFWSRFFDFRLRLLCVSDQDLIYVTQPLLQQVELINQKNQCRPVMFLASAGDRALGQSDQFSGPLCSARPAPPIALHSIQRRGLTTRHTLCGGSLPQYHSRQLGERVCENLGE